MGVGGAEGRGRKMSKKEGVKEGGGSEGGRRSEGHAGEGRISV